MTVPGGPVEEKHLLGTKNNEESFDVKNRSGHRQIICPVFGQGLTLFHVVSSFRWNDMLLSFLDDNEQRQTSFPVLLHFFLEMSVAVEYGLFDTLAVELQ